MHNKEKERNLQLIGVLGSKKASSLENLNEGEGAVNKKIIKFNKKTFKEGEQDSVLYDIKASNK